MKNQIFILITGLFIFAGCGSKKDSSDIKTDTLKTEMKDSTISKQDKPMLKRKPPKTVLPVKIKNVEYSAPGSEVGFVVARDLALKKELWKKQIYNVGYDKNLEKDVQDVFIDSLWVSGDMLMVQNEKGERYELNPETQNVIKK